MPTQTAIESLVETFINGNLKDAVKRAKRQPHNKLREAYQDFTGCSDRTACAAADFLKGSISFNEYCSIKHEEGDRQ
jgi:hypothetical protein